MIHWIRSLTAIIGIVLAYGIGALGYYVGDQWFFDRPMANDDYRWMLMFMSVFYLFVMLPITLVLCYLMDRWIQPFLRKVVSILLASLLASLSVPLVLLGDLSLLEAKRLLFLLMPAGFVLGCTYVCFMRWIRNE
ncbi:hypothetical protein [Aureibacillus halotolerans]|uniref:Uncharacterized protein n=1 Tax=Aureibacillus halotolerans TaxID=1508390 RepID=A0A4R6U436_9BACI|nr:hypothetical protein [Aureibacillus halotolerans]TDQ41248.1 hypothetical protein EV213_104246 [Aureibacillus halotolerans]